MSTLAVNTLAGLPAAERAPAARATAAKRSFLGRVLDAMIESRHRRAAIEIRRVQALMNEPKERLDYALLPFAGE